MDHFCYLCFVFVMLLVCSLQPARKGLASWLSLVCDFCILVFYCAFFTLSCGVLSQIWYLIALIPDLCPLICLLF